MVKARGRADEGVGRLGSNIHAPMSLTDRVRAGEIPAAVALIQSRHEIKSLLDLLEYVRPKEGISPALFDTCCDAHSVVKYLDAHP